MSLSEKTAEKRRVVEIEYLKEGEESPSVRRVEPYTIERELPVWRVHTWDLTVDAARTFRLDRISDVFQTRVHFEPRPMTDEAARERVETALRHRDRTVRARVVVELSRDELVERLGWYGRDVVADGPDRCIWPLEADAVETLAMALMWLPRGAAYRVEGPPEVLGFLEEQAGRFAAAAGGR